MKISILAAAIVAALSVPIASAQNKPAPAKPAVNVDTGKAAPDTAAPAMNMDTGQPSAKSQANMDKMKQQMDKISATTDPKERQKLLQAHMETMQENMKTMRDMGSDKTKCAGGQGAMATGDKMGGMPMPDMASCQDMGNKRMDMMQDMMEQMMQRDAAKPMDHM